MHNEPRTPSSSEPAALGRSSTTARELRAAAAVLIAAGAMCLVVATSASAATVGATATVATPGSLAALGSGGSATVFTVTLPANAACSGDTATGGYHIYSYLVPKGTNVTTLSYLTGPPTNTYGFVDNSGTYYGAANTAIGTGQIVSIPNNFEWAPLVTSLGVTAATLTGGTNAGVWEGGLLCAKSTGQVTDNWNTQITFAASGTDPNGFTWTAVPGQVTTTTTTTTTGATTTTTSSDGATTTTTASDGATTTTTAAVGVTANGTGGTPTGSGTGTGSDSGTGTGTSSTGGNNLAFTGIPVCKFVGAGLLAIGIGFMLLGWGYEHRRRATRTVHSSPW